MVRGVVGVVYSKQDSDSSLSESSRRQGTANSISLVSFFLFFAYELVHKIFPFLSEARDQLSARVLSTTDDDNQSQTEDPIKHVTDAASELDKPNDMHASDDNSQNRVRLHRIGYRFDFMLAIVN